MTMGGLTQMLSLVSPLEFQALQEICEYNDITEEQLICAPETITGIEMFMQGIPQICCMSFFPNLVSLSLVHQNIQSIEGLYNCPCLKILRLNENIIERIDGLQNCTRLVELYLHSNKIRYIKNISHLKELEVIWLANNDIHEIDGLEDCDQLKELNIAKNPIEQLGNISNLTSLQRLNAAATNVGSFKEVTKLTKIKALKDLRFLDYQWGKSPISCLQNYQTYVLFQLSNLSMLDAEFITEKQKLAAKATYTRKRVYYNMCIKSLRYRRNDVNMSSMVEFKQLNLMKRKFSELSKSRKDLEKEICTYLGYPADYQGGDDYVSFEEKAKTLDSQLCSVLKQIDALRKELQEHKCHEKESIDRQIQWLMMELNTGGNIRLETGSMECSWFRNCVETVTSRFSSDDFAPFGIINIRVRTVSRVHNRLLQDRFRKATEANKRKKHIEYLLYGETFQVSGELQSIIEEGFTFLSAKNRLDSSTPVFLSNSIGLADVCRLQKIFDHSQDLNISRKKLRGWVLIVKANLGVSVQDQHVGDEFVNVNRSSYPDADSVYRMHPSDPTQRSWYIFDSAMLVPEYLVEYEYVMRNQTPLSQLWKDKDMDMVEGSFVLPTSKIHAFIPRKNSVEGHHGKGVHCISSYSLFQRYVKNEFVNHITQLNLHDSNIHQLGPLKGLHNLKVLILSFNKISQVSGVFCELQDLEILDLSHNLLRQIDGLAHLRHLKTLDLAGNQITAMDDFQSLLFQVPQLSQLNLRGNPIEEFNDYRGIVLKSLVSLMELDCLPIDSGEGRARRWKEEENVTSSVQVGSDMMMRRRHALESETEAAEKVEEWWRDGAGEASDVEELELEHQHLKSMAFLAEFPNVRKVVLSGNEIRVLEGLQACKHLEELVVEDNRINQVEVAGCAADLTMLWRLDLGRNEMTSCRPLSCFSALTQLSIERNRIQSLQGLGSLQSLLEVYAAHNEVGELGEVAHMAALPRLMVLDLRGNPLCVDVEYRSYTIFVVHRIKVLDGKVVAPEEAAVANDRHAGRLTRYQLPAVSTPITALQLSNMDIRSCGTVFESPDIFLSLQELDLSNNLLTSIQPLRLLAKLKMLRLQNNNLKDGSLLLPQQSTDSSPMTTGSPHHDNEQTDASPLVQEESHAAPHKVCLGALEMLHLDGNSITNIMSLTLQETFPNLRMLSLTKNSITKVDGVRGLSLLQKLNLDHNCIKEIEPTSFEDLPSLEELDLSHNAMKCVQHLCHLSSLKRLNLASNYLKPDRFGGFPITAELSALKNLQGLTLQENPICRQPQYRCGVISKLLQLTSLDGRTITEEDLADAELYAATLMEQSISSVNCDPHFPSPAAPTSAGPVAPQTMNMVAPGRLRSFSPAADDSSGIRSCSRCGHRHQHSQHHYNCDYYNDQNRAPYHNRQAHPPISTPMTKVALKVTPFHFQTTAIHSNRSCSIPNLLMQLRPP